MRQFLPLHRDFELRYVKFCHCTRTQIVSSFCTIWASNLSSTILFSVTPVI
jgi:hypothetical protein